jgi:hypothetical protein
MPPQQAVPFGFLKKKKPSPKVQKFKIEKETKPTMIGEKKTGVI